MVVVAAVESLKRFERRSVGVASGVSTSRLAVRFAAGGSPRRFFGMGKGGGVLRGELEAWIPRVAQVDGVGGAGGWGGRRGIGGAHDARMSRGALRTRPRK